MSGTVVVTGSGGFIGRAVVHELAGAGLAVRAAMRRIPPGASNDQFVSLSLPGSGEAMQAACRGVDTVVHLAAHVHISGPGAFLSRPFQQVNVEGTRQLAEAAARAGVRHFVFLSSVGVHGRGYRPGREGGPYRESDPPQPAGAYARSKWQAESVLERICGETGMICTILRSPLVFGPGVPAGFQRLMRVISSGLPVPTGPYPVMRSMCYVENLAGLIVNSLRSAGRANEMFDLADFDVEIGDLVQRLAARLGSEARIWRLPAWAVNAGCALPVAGPMLRSLSHTFTVDPGRVRQALDWRPRVDLDTALDRTVQWYKATCP